MAGRLKLVKVVVHGMLIHSLTIYNWPCGIINKLKLGCVISFGVGIWTKEKLSQLPGINVAILLRMVAWGFDPKELSMIL